MGIISSLFGSPKIIDAAINGIDALVWPDQEKSSAKMKFLKLYEPYKLAQRYLALIVGIPYVLLWFLLGVSYLVDMWIHKELDPTALVAFLNGDMGTAFILVMSFYFAGGFGESAIRAFKENKSK